MNLTYCGNYPHLDHAACPSSVECAAVTVAEAEAYAVARAHMDTTARRTARLGNGTAVHLVDARGILCNRWGSTNGVVRSPRFTDAPATCKRCQKLASVEAPEDRATHRAHRGFTEGRTTGPGGLPEVAWFCHECMTGGRDA